MSIFNAIEFSTYTKRHILFSSKAVNGKAKQGQKSANMNGEEEDDEETNGNKRKGFASMSPQKRYEIAKKGGEARKRAAERGEAPSYSAIGHKGGKSK